MLASALRTDPHCLRQLEPTDPKVIELREWSRLREDLTRERTRLANRMREQLWRYYPQFLAAIDDVATPWALDLWRRLPTPTAAQRVREATLARVLKQHCIRRIDAATLRGRLRAPAIRVAPGTAEAAAAHIRLVTERLALVNRQLTHARRGPSGPADCRRLVRVYRETSLPRPPSRAKAMPGPDPPHHAKPRREVFSRRTQSSSGGPQLGHLPDVEPPVVAGLLRPPVADPDTAAARGQPRHQLIPVHQFLVDVGHADDIDHGQSNFARVRRMRLRPITTGATNCALVLSSSTFSP